MAPLIQRPMFVVFLVSWTLVHLGFEYNFWVRGDATVFTKYAAAEPAGLVGLAEKVYFTKATWMFVFVWLQVLRVPMTTAMAWSFLLYSVELLLFFPFPEASLAWHWVTRAAKRRQRVHRPCD